MTEKEILLSHIIDLKEKSANEGIITTSVFLSADDLSAVIDVERINNKYTDTFYYGGYNEAERKIAVFVPEFYAATQTELENLLNDNNVNPIKVLTIRKDKFSKLSHRDYLGAIMGLGLKREVIGDIIVNEEGCTVFCLKSIADYLVQNLKQAGRATLTVKAEDINSVRIAESKTETVFLSVASLRLDCLVAAAFKTSRNTATEGINQGYIYVNSQQIIKKDFILKCGDKLVFRGKGKVCIDEIVGESKKGRIHLNIKRYL